MSPTVSICIPTYNEKRIVHQTLRSALSQNYKNKEILVIDDCSTDGTYGVVKSYDVRHTRNEKNLGFTGNFNRLIDDAKGDIIVFLCGDDIFTDDNVVSDIVHRFAENEELGVIGRYYYQYIDGKPGAVAVIRDPFYVSCCNPSGIAFRRKALKGKRVGDKIFTEIPNLVKDVINDNWRFGRMKYDTIAARLHKYNEACNSNYYLTQPQQSMIQNWSDVLGYPFIFGYGLVQIKNRCPQLLWQEIKVSVKLEPKCLLNPGFVFCMLAAIIVPTRILRALSLFYRDKITRHFAKVVKRGEAISSFV
jgi:glycosyltransferase involved in cell wall biosynthesis